MLLSAVGRLVVDGRSLLVVVLVVLSTEFAPSSSPSVSRHPMLTKLSIASLFAAEHVA